MQMIAGVFYLKKHNEPVGSGGVVSEKGSIQSYLP